MFGRKPKVPPISDERAVVHWFLRYDDWLKDFRKHFAAFVPKAESEILGDLQEHPDGQSLLEHVRTISEFYRSVALPQAAMRHQQGGPMPGEDQGDFLKLMVMEGVLAAKLRILGYFLIEKFGIDSSQWTEEPDQSNEEEKGGIFKDGSGQRGYDFEENRHTEAALRVFNALQPQLASAPQGSNAYELFSFPLHVACAHYAQTTDTAGAEHFEKGLRIAIWTHSIRSGATDSQAKEITEFIFAKMLEIGLMRTRGEDFLSILGESASAAAVRWMVQTSELAERAAKAAAQ